MLKKNIFKNYLVVFVLLGIFIISLAVLQNNNENMHENFKTKVFNFSCPWFKHWSVLNQKCIY